MNATLSLGLPKVYPKRKEAKAEFEIGLEKACEFMLYPKLQELESEGFIRLATKKMHWEIPPKFPGKPLSEYVKEIKQ